ncbi:MAG: hypothetical protein HC927_03805 [Deltaproteobacteria bacterium]|nr:hypothetical protein [Deltaproteobacteria bacterium]
MALLSIDTASSYCQDWLSQFKENEVAAAELLLKQLVIVSATEFEQWLRDVREQVRLNFPLPVAAYAIRSIGDDEALFVDSETSPKRASGPIGSEGRIANVIKRWHADRKNVMIYDHPSIATMRNAKVRAIVLLDDILGSGQRAIKYVGQFLAHKTIRSWISGQQIQRIVVVTFASMPKGRALWERFIKKLPQSQRGVLHHCADYHAPSLLDELSSEAQETIKNLIENKRAKVPRNNRLYLFGYKKSMGSVIFEHGCPNNVPALLWSDSKPYWSALMPNRIVPEGLLNSGKSLVDHEPDCESISLGSSLTVSQRVPEWRGFLNQLVRGVRSTVKLSHYLKLRQTTVCKKLDILRELHMIGPDLRLTSSGRRLLEEAKDSESSHVGYIATLTPDQVYIPVRCRRPRHD